MKKEDIQKVRDDIQNKINAICKEYQEKGIFLNHISHIVIRDGKGTFASGSFSKISPKSLPFLLFELDRKKKEILEMANKIGVKLTK